MASSSAGSPTTSKCSFIAVTANRRWTAIDPHQDEPASRAPAPPAQRDQAREAGGVQEVQPAQVEKDAAGRVALDPAHGIVEVVGSGKVERPFDADLDGVEIGVLDRELEWCHDILRVVDGHPVPVRRVMPRSAHLLAHQTCVVGRAGDVDLVANAPRRSRMVSVPRLSEGVTTAPAPACTLYEP